MTQLHGKKKYPKAEENVTTDIAHPFCFERVLQLSLINCTERRERVCRSNEGILHWANEKGKCVYLAEIIHHKNVKGPTQHGNENRWFIFGVDFIKSSIPGKVAQWTRFSVRRSWHFSSGGGLSNVIWQIYTAHWIYCLLYSPVAALLSF